MPMVEVPGAVHPILLVGDTRISRTWVTCTQKGDGVVAKEKGGITINHGNWLDTVPRFIDQHINAYWCPK